MLKNIKKLVKEFNKIKKLGYVKSLRDGSTGVGYTFETLLNKKEDTSYLPDYNGIEIKTKLGNSNTAINLFSMVPNILINKTNPLYYLINNYGYIKDDKKRFYAKCYYRPDSLVQNKYYFELDIIYDLLVLKIKNKNKKLISNIIYWNIDELINRLQTKLNYLAYVTAYSKTINGEKYYKYKDIEIYKLKGRKEFIKLIKENKIFIEFNIEKENNENTTFLVHRGSTIRINKEHIEELFTKQ